MVSYVIIINTATTINVKHQQTENWRTGAEANKFGQDKRFNCNICYT